MTQYTKAKLIGYTQPAEEFKKDFKDIKDLVSYCARVSNPSNQMNNQTSDKLINYLLKHKHFSPFEMASITLEVETTRDIARQLLRHRSFTFQEFSQRYADPTKDLSFVVREARMQDLKNRQNSVALDDTEWGKAIAQEWSAKQQELIQLVQETYQWAVNAGIAKEQARAVLPEGLTMSRLYVQGTVRSFVHYLDVRLGNGTQLEHIELAREVAKAIGVIFKYEQN
jgi:thymidylate synthase (FAD)